MTSRRSISPLATNKQQSVARPSSTSPSKYQSWQKMIKADDNPIDIQAKNRELHRINTEITAALLTAQNVCTVCIEMVSIHLTNIYIL
jgi:hypothetical protein